MAGSPWIMISRKDGPALKIHSQVYKIEATNELHDAQFAPSIITFIGKREKSVFMHLLLGGPESTYPHEHHGQVHLWAEPQTRHTDHAIFLADCELHNHTPSHWKLPTSFTGPNAYTKLESSTADKRSSKELASLVYARILAPLSNVFCFFAADLNGVRGVARFLADHVQAHLSHDLSQVAKPHVLVIANTISSTAVSSNLEMKLMSLTKKSLLETGQYGADVDVEALIYSCFQSVRVLPDLQNSNLATRATILRERLFAINKEARRSRVSARVLFSYSHIQALCASMLRHLCSDREVPFSFIKASRPHRFNYDNLYTHLSTLLNHIPSEAWLWHLVVPLVSSALILATYPPGSHKFSPHLVFLSMYKPSCLRAIEDFTNQRTVQQKFLGDVEDEFCALFGELTGSNDKTAKSIHLGRLSQISPLLKRLKPHYSCFCCLLRMPEKVLDCGHAYCDCCIKIFGNRSTSERNTSSVAQCIICMAPHSSPRFTFLPPTAGVRLLSIDGGGVRGIIPLTILLQLEAELAFLGCPVWDYFDFVAGTSSGGIIGIGIFLLHWTPRECLEKFYAVAHETFKGRNNSLWPFSRIQSLLLTYLKDYQYNSMAIEAAFQSAFGPPLKMFNPLSSDMKVAVIAAPVEGKVTSVVCNYNGGDRPQDLGYCIIRANRREHDVTVDEAAQCTSAAPGYFKPKLLRHFGMHQDGALHHNNPVKIALWEQRFLWPDRSMQDQPDFILSIGTGTKVEKPRTTPQSQAQSSFFTRIFDAFIWNIDAERAWKEVINFTPQEFHTRYHRINLPIEDEEPPIDDISIIDILKCRTESFLLNCSTLKSFRDNLLASIFYFQLTEVTEADDRYKCTGYIYCRLDLPRAGRQALYHMMFESAAYFLVEGRPVPCVKSVPRYYPPFKCQIKFTVEDLSNKLYISIRGLTEKTWQLSGLPRSVADLMEAQGFAAVFGRADHQYASAYPPRVPQKRTYGSM